MQHDFSARSLSGRDGLDSDTMLGGYFAGFGKKNALPGKWGGCTLKAGQASTGVASVMSSRLGFIDESTGVIGSSGRATARSEEILPLSEQRGATGPDNALGGN